LRTANAARQPVNVPLHFLVGIGCVKLTLDPNEALEKQTMATVAITAADVADCFPVASPASPFLEIEAPSPALKDGLPALDLVRDFPGLEVRLKQSSAVLGQDRLNALSHHAVNRGLKILRRWPRNEDRFGRRQNLYTRCFFPWHGQPLGCAFL
jgi:hypothetical protein